MQTAEQLQILSYVNMICTPFSLAGAFYMIYSYFQSSVKSFSSKLVFCLALSDLLLGVGDAIDIFNPNSQNCTIMGFLRVAGIYSNMMWTTLILAVLYVQFVLEYAGVDRLFPYLVILNILFSLAPNLLTLYQMNFGGTLEFGYETGDCFITPEDSLTYIMIIPFSVLLMICIFMTIRVYMVFKNLATTLGNIEYKSLFMYPAVLAILNIPISVDSALQHPVFWLTCGCLVLFKSIGLINALQFRKATNVKTKLLRESQTDLILRTLTQDGESSFT